MAQIDDFAADVVAAYRAGGLAGARAKFKELDQRYAIKSGAFAVLQDRVRKLIPEAFDEARGRPEYKS